MKYIISVGHTKSGNIGSGASKYLDESDCTRQIAPLVVSKLQSLGNTVTKLQIDNSDSKDYVKRTNQANAIGGDMFVEIHLNSGGGTGCEVLTTNGSKASTQARKISQCISKALGITNRGHKITNGLYVLNHTNMPSLLIECCFVDSQKDYKVYDPEKIANAIVKGLTGQIINSKSTINGQWLRGQVPNENKWWYKHLDSTYTKSNWEQIDGNWYFFDYEGWMQCGKWIVWKDKDYYLYSNGQMAHDCVLYGYKFDSNGVATKI